MTYVPCHETHESHEEAMECVRRAAAERARNRSPEWMEQFRELLPGLPDSVEQNE
jgi:hypothetical protein